MLILTAGCHKESTESSGDQSQANEAIDITHAMKMLYGNYDVKKQTSVASLPKEKSSFPAAGEEQMTVRMLFHAFSGGADTRSFLLVTYAVPASDESYDCHACAPTIGMAIFSQKGMRWTIDASNRAVTFSGEWGKPPTDIQLVQIGPNRPAVKVIDVGEGNGETTAVLQLLIPWNDTVNLGLERIIADDDKGLCDSNGGLSCYANRRTLTFIEKGNVEYYDLELKLTGTDLPVSDAAASRRARKVHGSETLKFENGRYVQASRQGDLTYVDRVVREREGLK
jgi:hypothetical protein